jgi:DNA polymerase-4
MGRDLLDALLPLRQPVRLMGLTLSALEAAAAPGDSAAAPGDAAPAGQGTLPF